jgi:penicillin-binding protein 1A
MAEFGEERREPVTIDQVPETLIKAILAAEDDRFYTHPGVDFIGVMRAALANLRSGSHEQGASTITMQVARNYFLTREKTYTRKMREALLAFRLERALSKDQILELYINKIFLGHRAYGFAAAAKVYYGKDLDELSVAQMAMLAGLPKAPSRDNPLSNGERAVKRRNHVLRRMHNQGYVGDDELQQFLDLPLTASKHAVAVDVEAPYVAEMVRDHMLSTYGEGAYWRGFNVYTTLVGDYQQTARNALRDGLKAYDRRHGFRGVIGHFELDDSSDEKKLDEQLITAPASGELIPAVVISTTEKTATVYARDTGVVEIPWQGMSWARRYITVDSLGPQPKSVADILSAGDLVYVEQGAESKWRLSQLPNISGGLVSLRPEDGAILALVGGFDFYLSKFNRIMQAERQPGSNIKPFIYSAALNHGFTPATLVSGAPIVVADSSQDTVWRPENYSKKFFGPTRLRKALSQSVNLVSVRILRAIGIESALDHLARFGFDPDTLPRGLSLALGSGTITPIKVVRAYAIFANGGYRVEPYVIEWVENLYGELVEQAAPHRVCRACSPGEVETVAATGPGSGWRPAEQVLDSGNHFLITEMMHQVVRSGTARRALQLNRTDLAGKTGTTNDFRDAWFSGFNQDVVTTVWVGFDNSKTLGRREAGSRAALPIWIEYMKVALQGRADRPLIQPDNVVTRFVDKDSGEVVPIGHPNGFKEYFLASNAPMELPAAGQNGAPEIGAVPTASQPQPATTEGLF